MALVYAVARIIEDLPFYANLAYDLMRSFLRFEFLAQLFEQLPFAHELVLFGVGRVRQLRHHIVVIRQHFLVDFANVEKRIRRILQNMRHLPKWLFAVIRLCEHFCDLIFCKISRQR